MARPEFDSIRAYVDTLDAPELVAFLPCVISDLANTSVDGLDPTRTHDPDMQMARRVHAAYLAAVLQIMTKRLVVAASTPAEVATAHDGCQGFVAMLNQAKLQMYMPGPDCPGGHP